MNIRPPMCPPRFFEGPVICKRWREWPHIRGPVLAGRWPRN